MRVICPLLQLASAALVRSLRDALMKTLPSMIFFLCMTFMIRSSVIGIAQVTSSRINSVYLRRRLYGSPICVGFRQKETTL